MKTKHTKGPWGLLDLATHDSIVVWQTKNPKRNLHIATCLDYASANKAASEAEFERCLANAHLIAAAPEMLEALESAVAFFDAHKKTDGIDYDVANELRAAIKKARGEK
jgi:hypothetical protein